MKVKILKKNKKGERRSAKTISRKIARIDEYFSI